MRQHLGLAFALAALGAAGPAAAQSWVFRPAAYSHHPETGLRVAQFAPERVTYYRADDTYLESGYRHMRSALRGADGSYDYQHIVQTWGLGEYIRPYGEWEYPYRAGATPYGPWGNPSGPWTLPFDSWMNPYGLGKLPNPPWYPFYGPYGGGPGYGGSGYGGPGHGPGYGGGPGGGYPPHGSPFGHAMPGGPGMPGKSPTGPSMP
jgi:hypothetical protein